MILFRSDKLVDFLEAFARGNSCRELSVLVSIGLVSLIQKALSPTFREDNCAPTGTILRQTLLQNPHG
jgi:hypothetical protein